MTSSLPPLFTDLLGWGAALLTLLTFVSGEMRRLRLLALGANAAFIGYGALAGLLPVLALHLVLVPVNLWRLWQALRMPPAPNPAHGKHLQRPTPLSPIFRQANDHAQAAPQAHLARRCAGGLGSGGRPTRAGRQPRSPLQRRAGARASEVWKNHDPVRPLQMPSG